MSGCLVGLIWNLMVVVLMAVIRVIGFLVMLMVTSVASLFVGVETAIDRISVSWIEQSTGGGIPIGYNPAAREGLRAAAGGLLVLGWFLNIVVIFLLLSLLVNS